MKVEDAKKVSGLLDDLKNTNKKKQGLDNTKEFCKIHIEGEDGTEREYSLHLSHQHDPELIKRIREVIHGYLNEIEEKTIKEIEAT